LTIFNKNKKSITMKRGAIFLLLFTTSLAMQLANGQAKKKKMPRNINMMGYDNFGPAISGDGKSMIYMSNYTNDGSTAIMYSKKTSASSWKDPAELPRTINIPHLTYQHGYCLNFDGSEFYFTFKKSGGLGGFDLWMAKLQDGNWAAAQNLGSPINSSLNDGSPSISSDGNTMYFMSCETMTNNDAAGCKLMMSTRSSTKSRWRKPIALPGIINQGNAQSPNILADGETMMYLSDHEGSMQWYWSRMEEGEWIEPQRMSFIDVNHQRNISVPAKSRYVFHDVQGERGRIIEQLLIPQEFKPKDVLRVIGAVQSKEGGTMKVYDVDSRERKIFMPLTSGDTYDFVLKEGHVYDISFESSNNQFPTTSEIFDLTEMKFSTRKKWDVNPKMLGPGDSLRLPALQFDTTLVEVDERSVYELRRLVRLLSAHVDSGYNLTVYHYPLDTATVLEPVAEAMTIADDGVLSDTLTSAAHGDDMEGLETSDSLGGIAVDTVAVTAEEVVIPPTMVENLASALIEKLSAKNITEDQCSVRGMTIPLTAYEGNEELADRVVVYLKKRE
jgi:hypothetical protein